MVARRSSISTLLVIATSVGLSVAVMTLLLPERTHEDTASPPADEFARIEALEARLSALEGRESNLREAPSTHEGERQPIDQRAEFLSMSALEQRLAALEQHSRRPTSRQIPVQPIPDRPQRDGLTPGQVIAAAGQTILDPHKTSGEKLEAHKRLRRVKDAYSPAMVQEMIRIGLHDPDAGIRAQVWCFFDGSSAGKLPELVNPLLSALRNDTSSDSRNEAAETLGNYPGNREVVAALEYAARNDSDPDVRRKAIRSLLEINPNLQWVR